MPKPEKTAKKLVKGITEFASVIAAAEIIINSESIKKAAVTTKDASKKVVKKVIRIDDGGHRVFKYTKSRLSDLYCKEKIPEYVYDYLANELQYVSFFSDSISTFEARFKDIIKAKNEEELSIAIERYEKIRSKHIIETDNASQGL